MKSSIFWNITKCSQRISQACWFLVCFLLTMKMEAKYSPEKRDDFQWITQRYILEDRTLQIMCLLFIQYKFITSYGDCVCLRVI
jgi:hypothetical protein